MSLQGQSPFISAAVSSTPPPPELKLTSTASVSAAPPPKKNRCLCCNKRLALTDYDCRCGQRYCSTHRLPEAHDCVFDFHTANRTVLDTQLIRVVGDKLDRI
jgi:predicted nucleic acid binding AN1-type Zn finger protein